MFLSESKLGAGSFDFRSIGVYVDVVGKIDFFFTLSPWQQDEFSRGFTLLDA
jgi:hypothetical protein